MKVVARTPTLIIKSGGELWNPDHLFTPQGLCPKPAPTKLLASLSHPHSTSRSHLVVLCYPVPYCWNSRRLPPVKGIPLIGLEDNSSPTT